MRVFVSAVAVIGAVMCLSACQSGPTGPAAPSASPSASPTSTVAPASASGTPESTSSAPIPTQATTTQTAPPPSPSTVPAASPCARVTAQELQQVANASHASSGPIVLGEPQCKQFWAMAWAVRTAVAPQPAGYLFQVTAEGNWRYLAVGTAIDCTSRYGVPADVASALRGCR